MLAAHTPDNAAQHKQWADEYHWKSSHDWEFPMLPDRFVESSCVKCHHEITDLVRQGNKEEAPKLQRGFDLVRENGCFGCHEIAGIKKGQEIGPDLRLEPSPALAWLSPTDQEKAKSDPLNPPGTYRKVGPSLRRIAEKTNEEWARRWIQSPRGFRPDTKMPHFYNLSTNNPDALPEEQKDFPAAEIHSIAHYIFAESPGNLEGKDTYRVELRQQLHVLQDKLAKESLGREGSQGTLRHHPSPERFGSAVDPDSRGRDRPRDQPAAADAGFHARALREAPADGGAYQGR